MWSVDYKYIASWLNEQDNASVASIFASLKHLEQEGPALGRPLVDTLAGTQVKNLKELRPASPGRTEIRILFAFDPERKAIMLFWRRQVKRKERARKMVGMVQRSHSHGRREIFTAFKAVGRKR